MMPGLLTAIFPRSIGPLVQHRRGLDWRRCPRRAWAGAFERSGLARNIHKYEGHIDGDCGPPWATFPRALGGFKSEFFGLLGWMAQRTSRLVGRSL